MSESSPNSPTPQAPENPYRSPSVPLEIVRTKPAPRHGIAQFRWHLAAAPVTGFLIAGNRHEATSPIEILEMSLVMSWGPWQPGMNLLLVSGVLIAVSGLQIAKRGADSEQRIRLAVTQIALWWFIWLLFGMAERFGLYAGP